ncbi:MAG: hypothetical protein ACAI44_05995, partial [Candidatus Sericytochromatia bacterium]
MSDIHLSSNVFKVFERISSDKQITAKEAAELKAAIKADGKVDENETALLDNINSKLGGSYTLTVSSDNKRMSFDPTAIDFDPQAKASLQKLEDEGNFSKYNARLPALLAEAEKHNDLEALSAAYSNISSTLDSYHRQGVPGISASLRKLAESMARIEKRDLLMSQDQKTKWQQFKYSVAPKESMEQLKQMLLSNKMKNALDRQVALDFIRETLPPAKTVAFLKQYVAAHPSEQEDVRYMLAQISKGSDKAGAQAARQAIKALDTAKAATDQSELSAKIKELFAQSPLPIADIAKAISNPGQRNETVGHLLSYLDQAEESVRLQALLDLDAAIPKSDTQARLAMDEVLLAYPAQSQKPAEIVRAALWRASKSPDRQYQANTLEAIGRQYPQDKRIKEGLENLLKQQNLTPSGKVALERALLPVDPEAGARLLSKHLAPPAQNLSIADQRAAIQSILRATDGNPELAAKFAPLIKELIEKGPTELLPQLADGLQHQRWPDREAYGLMLKHSRNLESVRLSAISGLGQLAKQGDQAAMQALA